jgi:CHAT domain-containing protein
VSAGTIGQREPESAPHARPHSHLPCEEVPLADAGQAIERYNETVERNGATSKEARAQAAAIGAHYSLQRQLPKARKWYERAILGVEEPPSTVQDAAAYQGLGWTLARTPDREKGVHYLSLAVAAWPGLLGTDSACEGIALERLANCLSTAGRHREALPDFLAAMKILSETLGRDSLPYLRACHGYANALASEGRTEEALPYYREVCVARHRLLPHDDPRLAWICHDYALALHGLGWFLEAEPLYRESMDIRKDRFPELYRQSASGLASCLTDRGDLLGAQRVLEDVLDSADREEPPDPVAQARARRSMASLRLTMGDYDAAEDLYESVIRILGDDLGEHPYLDGLTLSGLSQIAHHNVDIALAETLQRRVLVIWRNVYGSESVYIDAAKGTLAEILVEEGRAGEADSLFREALSHISKRKDQARYYQGLIAQDYSTMLLHQGRLSPAAAWIDTTLTAFATTLPPGHLNRIRAYETASQIHFAGKAYSQAWDEALIAEREGERLFQVNIRGLAETAALLYEQGAPRGMPVLLSLLARTRSPSSKRIQTAWESLIASRNAVSRELIRRRLTAAGPEAQALRDSIDQERQEIANLYVQGPSTVSEHSYLQTIAGLERHLERLEERFALLVPPAHDPPSPGLPRLRKALDRDAALVALVRYQDAFVSSPADAYGAFVLRPDAAPRFVYLCAADSLDHLVDRVQEHMKSAPSLLRLDPEETEKDWRALGTELRKALWDRLGDALAGATTVYLVPDGAAWRISYPSLPAESGGYLVEYPPAIHILGSERDLVASPGRFDESGILVVGGADYDRCEGRSAPSKALIHSHPPFEALPDSRREAETVASIWNRSRPGDPVVELLGDKATETAFRRDAPRVAVLHLATHGFLPGTAEDMTLDSARQAGIALAGANTGGCSEDDDGILTASELSMLELEGTRLVFLSSCGSGLGALVPSEGIVGLERSLRVAGCRSMILTLWDVPDRPTREWVERFYKFYAAPGCSVLSAQRKACTETLAVRRSLGRSTHPFYWGGFAVID